MGLKKRSKNLRRTNEALETESGEREQSENRLRRSEAYLAEAQQLSHTGSFGWDVSNGEIYWSQETFRIFECDPTTKVTVALVLQRTHPEDRAAVQQLIERVTERGIAFDFEHRLLMPDGSVKYVRVVGRPHTNESGRMEFVGAVTDVSDRKQAEQALRRNEEYLAEAQRLNRAGGWAIRPGAKKAHYWSEEMFRIWGFEPQHGIPDWQVAVERVHPDERDMIRQAVEHVLEGNYRLESEGWHRLVMPDGRMKYVHALTHPFLDDAGNVVEYVGTTVDVTERKHAEEALRRSQAYLAESQRLSKTGSWALRPPARKAHYWSEEMFRIWGFDPENGPPDWQDLSQRIHPDDRDWFRRGRAQLLEARLKVELAGDFRVVLPDERVKYIHAILHPVFDEAGQVVEYFGTDVDVTERKRAEEERERLRQLEADLEHINRVSMMGELAASLAHELNQPVTAAVTNAKTCVRWLSRSQPDLEEAREAAIRMVKDGTRAAETINGLRSFYKKGASAQREAVDVGEVIREMTALLRDEAIRWSVSVNPELAGGMPKVMADRVQLRQVFMNLMLNAMEAMQKTGGELAIKSELDADGQLLISVSDTGVGLPPQRPEQIFDAFYTTKPSGTGVGLAITRRIIEAHGGRLWASANKGSGATFHFTLPRARAASASSTD